MKRDIENLRALLFASLVTLAVAMVLSYIQMPISEAQQAVFAYQGMGAVLEAQVSEYLFLCWLLIYVIAHVLAFFPTWLAKPLFLLSFAFSVLMPALNGVSIGSPWDNTAWMVHSVVSTFAIGMLFFVPGVSARVRKDWLDATSSLPPSSTSSTPIALPTDGL